MSCDVGFLSATDVWSQVFLVGDHAGHCGVLSNTLASPHQMLLASSLPPSVTSKNVSFTDWCHSGAKRSPPGVAPICGNYH